VRSFCGPRLASWHVNQVNLYTVHIVYNVKIRYTLSIVKTHCEKGQGMGERPTTYHHGHLRQALLAAAEDLLVAGGIEALSWREIARRAGVSPGAPYHHFADKAALLTALAQQHLHALDHHFQLARAAHTDPHAQLRALGLVYVTYALDHQAAFRLMFRPEMGSPFGGDLDTTPVFGILLQVVQACRADSGGDASATERVALAAWGLVHGLAALLLDGPLAPLAGDRAQVQALVLTSTAHFLVNP
jgi:AcrR family transcriptional regulator